MLNFNFVFSSILIKFNKLILKFELKFVCFLIIIIVFRTQQKWSIKMRKSLRTWYNFFQAKETKIALKFSPMISNQAKGILRKR